MKGGDMTNKKSPNEREARPVAGLLWATNKDPRRAPDWLGGQPVSEQGQALAEAGKRDGAALRTYFTCLNVPDEFHPDARLEAMLHLVETYGVKHLYVTKATFANDTEDELMKHHVMLLMHGARLTICEDE
jgi:hypothetical protein